MSDLENDDLELQTQILYLQQDLQELKDKYDVSLQNEKLTSLEKDEIEMELERLKEENDDLSATNDLLRNIHATMRMERDMLEPTLMDLESSHHEKSQLQYELKENQQNMKKLNSENMQIKQENEQYKLGLEQIDDELRRKEVDKHHNIKILEQNIVDLKHENEELNEKLLRYENEMDLYSKHTMYEEEKVSAQLLNRCDDIEINVINVEEDEDIILPSSLEAQTPHASSEDVLPLILNKPSIISSRKTSILLSFKDLASVLQKTESCESETNVFRSLRSNLLNIHKKSNHSLRGLVNATPDAIDELSVIDYDLHRQETDGYNFVKEVEERDDEIKRLKLENKMLLDAHLEIQNTLKKRLNKKQKRIHKLEQRNEEIEVKLNKKSMSFIPWCSA